MQRRRLHKGRGDHRFPRRRQSGLVGIVRIFEAFGDAFAGHLKPERTEPSILYRNEGGNRFADVTEQMALIDTGWSGAATPIDVNEDGWIDLYTLDMQGHDEFYENQGGRGSP